MIKLGFSRSHKTSHNIISLNKSHWYLSIGFFIITAFALIGHMGMNGGVSAATIQGTKKKDYIFATDPTNIIKSGAGNDEIHGGTGVDKINGGAGDDYILGNDGNDDLVGGPGADSIFGGPGNDKINGGAGDDFLVGNDGDDLLIGGAGADAFICDSGNDIVKDFKPTEGDTISGNCKIQ